MEYLGRCAAATYLVLALTLTLVLVLRFFNYRVVPDIPSLISSLEDTSSGITNPAMPMGLKNLYFS